MGRSLAEKRTIHLLQTHQKKQQLEQELFQRKHNFEMNIAFERNSTTRAQLETDLQVAIQQWENAKVDTVKTYEHYLRAMFDEWNSINPALIAEHERFYQRMLDDYQRYH